jgi:lipopolysaccharide export system protein LptC
MKQFENIFYIAILGLVGLLSIWLQTEVRNEDPATIDYLNRHDPDYYIENFTATGMDETGKKSYVLQAARMAHFPDDDSALLDNPHLIEFSPDAAPRHTYAKSGWLAGGGDELLMEGKVKIIQEAGFGNPGGTVRAKKMKFHLDKNIKESLK